jgi:hypothetical protein
MTGKRRNRRHHTLFTNRIWLLSRMYEKVQQASLEPGASCQAFGNLYWRCVYFSSSNIWDKLVSHLEIRYTTALVMHEPPEFSMCNSP